MIGSTRRSAVRAAQVWAPLGPVITATRGWVPTPEAFRVADADRSKPGPPVERLTPTAQAALLNAVLYGRLLPDRAIVGPGQVPYPIPVFAPVRTWSTSPSRRGATEVQVLPLAVTVDGVSLAELGCLPVLERGTRHTVVIAREPSRHKVLETGRVTVSVGVGPGPAAILEWTGTDGSTRRAEVRSGAAVPSDAPGWMESVLFDGRVIRPTARDLSVCFAMASELAGRATTRLLAQLRPLVAAHLRRQPLRGFEITRVGGTPSSVDDRANDLFECLVQHVRHYVDKAVRDEGEYVRELFPYVLACFKPAVARSELAYLPRTGHQSCEGVSVRVSELSAALRRHAAINRLEAPAAARDHHAVHWVLARRFRKELDRGDLTMADITEMWERRQVPRGVRIPELATWQQAIGHESEHVPIDEQDGQEPAPAEAIEDGLAHVHGGARNRPAPTPDEDDLEILLDPAGTGFFALSSYVASRLELEEPDAWKQAVRHHRAVSKLLRTVLEPFTPASGRADAASLLYDACTVDGAWVSRDEIVARWEQARLARFSPTGAASA
jgi:hypothetical protein